MPNLQQQQQQPSSKYKLLEVYRKMTSFHNHPALRCWSPNPPPGQMQTATTAGHGIKLIDDKYQKVRNTTLKHTSNNILSRFHQTLRICQIFSNRLSSIHIYTFCPFISFHNPMVGPDTTSRTSRIKRRMRLLATATSKPCTGRLGCQAPLWRRTYFEKT